MEYYVEVAMSLWEVIVEEFRVEDEDDFIGGVKW